MSMQRRSRDAHEQVPSKRGAGAAAAPTSGGGALLLQQSSADGPSGPLVAERELLCISLPPLACCATDGGWDAFALRRVAVAAVAAVATGECGRAEWAGGGRRSCHSRMWVMGVLSSDDYGAGVDGQGSRGDAA